MNFNIYKRKKNVLHNFDLLVKNKNPIKIKKLIIKIRKSLGRDKYGQLMYHRGGGVPKMYRLLNNQSIKKVTYRILEHQYDPYRSCFINLIQYKTGELSYILAETNSTIKKVINDNNIEYIKRGASLYLQDIPTSTRIYNIERFPGKNANLSKSAGSFSKIFKKTDKDAIIKLPSGKYITLDLNCKANVGIPSNIYKSLNKKYKAGTNRYLNKRPIVRGVAMNPVDHPHGGGHGSGTGRPSSSPWGKLTKGVPTKKK